MTLVSQVEICLTDAAANFQASYTTRTLSAYAGSLRSSVTLKRGCSRSNGALSTRSLTGYSSTLKSYGCDFGSLLVRSAPF